MKSVTLVSPEEGYRRWAPTFDTSPNPIVALEARHLEASLSGVSGKRVVDVWCGTGRWLDWITKRGARAVGCDSSAEMLREARRKVGGIVVQGDALQLPFATGIADIVLCTLSLGYLFGRLNWRFRKCGGWCEPEAPCRHRFPSGSRAAWLDAVIPEW